MEGRKTERGDNDPLIPSNRFRMWVETVPKDMRRWAYSVWRDHIKSKLESNVRGDDYGKTVTEEELNAEFETWEKTQLRGAEARKTIEERSTLAQTNFDTWLGAASKGRVRKEDVLYAALMGSSYILPRSAADTDIDIGIILKEGIKVPSGMDARGNMFGLNPMRIDVLSDAYSGHVDFFFYNPAYGNIFFVISPHLPLYTAPEFDQQTLARLVEKETDIVRSDFASIRGEGMSQEELREVTRRAVEQLKLAIEKMKSSQ